MSLDGLPTDERHHAQTTYLGSAFRWNLHIKRIRSVSAVKLCVITSASLTVCTIGQELAQARGLTTKHAIRQVDRLLSNSAIHVWEIFADWVPEAVGVDERTVTWAQRFDSLWRIWPVIVLIAAVLGTIYTGVATSTEPAAIGSLGAFLVALLRGKLDLATTRRILRETMVNTGMILAILASALVFGYLLTRLRVPQDLVMLITESGLSEAVILIGIFALLIVMGMFMDVAPSS